MSWLLSLPAELREMIYTFALTDDDCVEPTDGKPALLQANRQVRREASPIYYTLNAFAFSLSSDTQLRAWLRSLGPFAQHVRSIILDSIGHSYHFERAVTGGNWIIHRLISIMTFPRKSFEALEARVKEINRACGGLVEKWPPSLFRRCGHARTHCNNSE